MKHMPAPSYFTVGDCRHYPVLTYPTIVTIIVVIAAAAAAIIFADALDSHVVSGAVTRFHTQLSDIMQLGEGESR